VHALHNTHARRVENGLYAALGRSKRWHVPLSADPDPLGSSRDVRRILIDHQALIVDPLDRAVGGDPHHPAGNVIHESLVADLDGSAAVTDDPDLKVLLIHLMTPVGALPTYLRARSQER